MITHEALERICKLEIEGMCNHEFNESGICLESYCPYFKPVSYEYFVSGTYYLNGESFVYSEYVTLNYKITQRDMDDVVLELRNKLKTTATIYITNFILTKTITEGENK
jgi:hypothetical protein